MKQIVIIAHTSRIDFALTQRSNVEPNALLSCFLYPTKQIMTSRLADVLPPSIDWVVQIHGKVNAKQKVK